MTLYQFSAESDDYFTFSVRPNEVFLGKMEKEKFRAVIEHFYLKKWKAAQTKVELDEVHGNTALTLKTVYFWINEF